MNRDKAINIIQNFPEEFKLEDLLGKLIFTEKVEIGLKQLKEEKTTLHEKVKEIVKEW